MKRFWTKVDKSGGPEACWPWKSTKIYSGYGHFWFEGGPKSAHRVAWLLSGNELSPGAHVLHSCDNRSCCNPRHLRLGTHTENIAEAVAKDRFPHGETMWNARLTDEAVRDIRQLAAAGVSLRAIGRRYKMNHGNISRIIRQITWRRVA